MRKFSHDLCNKEGVFVKIWFSKDPSHLFSRPNSDDQRRLVDFVIHNPDRSILFIYSEQLLNQQGQQELAQFQESMRAHHNLSFLDASSQQFAEIAFKNQQEKRLFELLNMELRALSEGGNVGAASDICRLMCCTISEATKKKIVIYSDFDAYISPTPIEGRDTLYDVPDLIGANVVEETDNGEVIPFDVNNDVLIVIEPEQCEQLTVLQSKVIENYHDPVSFLYQQKKEDVAKIDAAKKEQVAWLRETIFAVGNEADRLEFNEMKTVLKLMESILSSNQTISLFAFRKAIAAIEQTEENADAVRMLYVMTVRDLSGPVVYDPSVMKIVSYRNIDVFNKMFFATLSCPAARFWPCFAERNKELYPDYDEESLGWLPASMCDQDVGSDANSEKSEDQEGAFTALAGTLVAGQACGKPSGV